MAIGPDVQVFISAARALLQSKSRQALNEEEQEELKCCVDEIVTATNYEGREIRKRTRKPLSRLIPAFLKRLARPTMSKKRSAGKLPHLAHS
jgi:hypothetical protein